MGCRRRPSQRRNRHRHMEGPWIERRLRRHLGGGTAWRCGAILAAEAGSVQRQGPIGFRVGRTHLYPLNLCAPFICLLAIAPGRSAADQGGGLIALIFSAWGSAWTVSPEWLFSPRSSRPPALRRRRPTLACRPPW